MFKLLLNVLTLLFSLSYSGMVVERWGASSAKCQYANTVTYNSTTNILNFNLSALSSSTTIYKATLFLFMDNEYYGQHVSFLKSPDENAAIDMEIYKKAGTGYDSDTIDLVPPYYRSFELTAIVQEWLANPLSNQGLYVKFFPSFAPTQSYLEICYDGTLSNAPQQVGGFEVIHHHGQTFITWNELQDHFGTDDIKSGDMIDVLDHLDNTEEIRYHIYRHTSPITAANIHQADLLDFIRPVSCFNNMIIPMVGTCEHCTHPYDTTTIIPRFCIDNSGTPLARTKALYVYTAQEDGNYYYAVISTRNGKQNTSDFSAENSLNSPVAETAAEYPVPVFQFFYENSTRLFFAHYTNFLGPKYSPWPGPRHAWDEKYDDRFTDGVYYANVEICYNPLNVKTDSKPAIRLMLEHPGALRNKYMGWTYTNNVCVWIHTVARPSMWSGTVEAWGKYLNWKKSRVIGYDRNRTLKLADWALRTFAGDSNRVYIAHREGYWGILYPKNIAQVRIDGGSADMGLKDPYPPFSVQTPYRIHNWWGQEEWNIPYENTGVSAWDWFDMSWQVKSDSQSMPPVYWSTGSGHDWKGSCDHGWGGQPKFLRAMQRTKHAFEMRWTGFGSNDTLPAGYTIKRWCCVENPWRALNESYPAFTNFSLDADIGDTLWDQSIGGYSGVYQGHANGFVAFDNDILDESAKWETAFYMNAGTPAKIDSAIANGYPLDEWQTIDITPRRLQNFNVDPCDEYNWEITENGAAVQSGVAKATCTGVITAENVPVTLNKRRIVFTHKESFPDDCPSVSIQGKNVNDINLLTLNISPNPFNPNTRIQYSIESRNFNSISLCIYDASGKLVNNFSALANQAPKQGRIIWSGIDRDGNTVSSGLYIIIFKVDGHVKTSKLLLLK